MKRVRARDSRVERAADSWPSAATERIIDRWVEVRR